MWVGTEPSQRAAWEGGLQGFVACAVQGRAQCAPSLGACGSSYARGVWLHHALCHDLWNRQILAENS